MSGQTHLERIYATGLSARAYNEGMNKVAHALCCLERVVHNDPLINLNEAKKLLNAAQKLLNPKRAP